MWTFRRVSKDKKQQSLRQLRQQQQHGEAQQRSNIVNKQSKHKALQHAYASDEPKMLLLSCKSNPMRPVAHTVVTTNVNNEQQTNKAAKQYQTR